jgi:hypothetical protein
LALSKVGCALWFLGGQEYLPLVHFFRMRLPPAISTMLMGGATMLTSKTDCADEQNFPRWHSWANSGEEVKAQHTVEELLLRVERMFMEPYTVVSSGKDRKAESGSVPPFLGGSERLSSSLGK